MLRQSCIEEGYSRDYKNKIEDQNQSLSYHDSQFLGVGIQCLQIQKGAAGRPLQREEAQGWGSVWRKLIIQRNNHCYDLLAALLQLAL